VIRKTFTLNARGRKLVLGTRTAVMGVVNLTPDSFSGDGRLSRRGSPVAFALKMIKDGADLIDIGGESTRPGAKFIVAPEEMKRIIPTVERLSRGSQALISVDTYKPEVARAVLEAGAHIINNVQGTAVTKPFLSIIRDYDAAIVLMHSRGTPQTMQTKTKYKDLLKEIGQELERSVEKCLSAGIKSDRIILDPGIGFAKTVQQNLEVLKHLQQFQKLGFPILVGTSRKSFIGKVLNAEVSQRSWGTASTVAVSILNGAHIVRVHDVAAMRQTAEMADAILNA